MFKKVVLGMLAAVMAFTPVIALVAPVQAKE